MNCFIQDKNKVRIEMVYCVWSWKTWLACTNNFGMNYSTAVSELSCALLPEWEQISPYFQKNGAVIITKGGPTCINDQVFENNSTCGCVVWVSILFDI